MLQWSLSKDAQVALIKLMAKAGLINSAHEQGNYPEFDRMRREGVCPVAWFARTEGLDEAHAIKTLSERLKIPLIEFDRTRQSQVAHLMKSERLSAADLSVWQGLKAVPVEYGERYLTVAFANPLDHQSCKHLGQLLGLTIRPAIAREDSIDELLGETQRTSTDGDLEQLLQNENSEVQFKPGGDIPLSQLETTLTSADLSAPPIVRLVNKIIADAIQHGASDIHVTPEKEILLVAIRIDGMMRPLFSIPVGVQAAVTSRIKLLAGMDIAERRRPQDGRMRVKAAKGMKDLRVSTVPTAFGESVVIRILSSDLSKLTLQTLGVDDYARKQLEQALKSSSRVVLVTGPTGSGKTSTLYASLMLLHDGTNSIITVEDPIEYKIEGINQIQVNPKVGVTFAEGLRSILRQDPDVIMVGEIRDLDTAEIAMQAAQTGHLVLSTLHTNTAAGAVTRLRDLGLSSYVIASSLGTIVAQRLLRRLCEKCVEPHSELDSALARSLGIESESVKRAKGCEHCGNSGYKGRIGFYSILEVTERVREAIRLERSEFEIESAARAGGFRSLLEAGVAAVNRGITSLDELERTIGSLELLAAEQATPLQDEQTPLASTHTVGNGTLTKRRILLVEDDENTRLVLSLLLKREMFDVIEATDGADALDKLYEHPPELVVCDLMMPRMNGLEFVQMLRKDKRVRTIPVLMLTAADGEENELSSLTSGADDFVSKTADSRVMLARVHRLLDRAD